MVQRAIRQLHWSHILLPWSGENQRLRIFSILGDPRLSRQVQDILYERCITDGSLKLRYNPREPMAKVLFIKARVFVERSVGNRTLPFSLRF